MLSKEQLLSIKFTNLVQHSHWTIPMGIGNVKKQIQGTYKKGLHGFAITDHNVMSGVLETYFLSKDKDFLAKNKIEKLPIAIGARLSFTDDLENKDAARLFNLTLFAKSMKGYRNLIYLNSISSDETHFFESNRLSIAELMERSEDLVIGSGGVNGLLGQAIVKGTGQEEDLAAIFKENFGENFFIEIHFHPVSRHWDIGLKKYVTEQEDLQKTVNLRLIEIANKLGIKCCLVQNSYMIEEKHFALQSILIQNHPDYKKGGWTMDQAYNLMSVEEMYGYIQKNSSYISDSQFLEYCANTQDILNLCKNIKLDFSPSLPTIKYEEHQVNTDKSYETKLMDLRQSMIGFCDLLVHVIDKSLTDISLRTTIKTIIRLNKIDWTNKVEVERLAFELKVMQLNGVIRLLDYFLLLEDVTNYVVSIGKYRGFGRGCLTNEALVLTQNGYKNIDKVVAGDQVVTHKGNYKKVIKTFEHKIDSTEELIKVYTQRSYKPITFTLDHKVYGVKREELESYNRYKHKDKVAKYQDIDISTLQFAPISSFKEGDLLFTATPRSRKIKDIKSIDLSKYVEKGSPYKILDKKIELYASPTFKGKRGEFKRFLKFDEELVYQIGKWIGDGWNSHKPERHKYNIGYAFNSDDTVEIKRTVDFYKNLGFSVTQIRSKKTKLVQVNIYSKILSLFFKDLFPNYENSAFTKYIGKLKHLPDAKLEMLIKGLKSADGSDVDDHGGDRRECIDTVSPKLMEDIRESLTYLNIPSTIATRKGYFDKRLNCEVRDSYKVTFIGLEVNRKGHQKDFINKKGFFTKIRKLEKTKGVEKVYDLMVEDDHSFLTSEYTVHNSGGGSFLTYVMDISDIQPVKYDLLFERFLTKERIGTYFFDIKGYDFKNKDEEDLLNPFFDKVRAMLDKKRSKEVNQEYLEKELFYLECNPNIAEYIYNTATDLMSKNQKIENENNSVISYCLSITDTNPQDFIKSTPTTLPDFDYDTDARDEVKTYLTNKYGKNHVTLMGTIGTLKTKGALKDIIRQMRPLKDSNGVILKKEMTFDEVNELSKKFNLLKPTDFQSEIDFYNASIEADAGLKKWINDNKDIDEALRMLLGNAKSTGIHAGGIVVSARNVLEVMPMTWSFDEQMWITQSEMGYVERVGLIKYDFLGLKTLGDLNRVLHLVNTRHNKNYTLSNVPMEDKDVLDLFVQGKTESVFQFNTDLAVSILIQLKEVRSLLDLAMITSIARPGPLQMGMDKTFILRNTGKEEVEYLHPALKSILSETYGILCIAKGSQVLTKKGQKNIEDVQVGEKVLTEDGSWQKVIANYYKGQKKTIRVRTSNGEELVCTADHKVLTQHGWKEAGKLTKNDLIKSFWVGPERKEVGTNADWLIGLALADGNLCGSTIDISCSSKDFAEQVKVIAEDEFKLKNVSVTKHQRCWKANLSHLTPGGGIGSKFSDRINPFNETIKNLKLKGLDCYNKFLPENYNLSMIAGFIEGDGSLQNNTVRLKNKQLAYGLYLALQSYRIPSSYFEDKDGVFNVSFNDHKRIIPFKIKEFKNGTSSPHVFIPRSYLPKLSKKEYGTQSQLTNPSKMNIPLKISSYEKAGFDLKGKHDHWSRVLSINEDKVMDVYDLSIENVHSFVVGGIVVHNCYQEQIILAAKAVGDFDNDSSVSIMKALSKKQLEKVVKYKEKFIKNAQKHGFTEAKATQFWNLMESFASYGFNKSHAAAYGAVSYLCMWFKHYYPAEWASAVLSGADKDDFKILYPKWKDLIKKPDINRSKDSFVIDQDNMVVMPINAINGIGVKAVENIIKNQPYSNFEDFYKKVDTRQVNKKTVISLIFAGMFDSMKSADISENKWRKMLILEFLKLKYAAKKPSKAEKEEDDLFMKDVANMNRGAMLMREISLLNFTAFNYFEYYKDKMTDGAKQKFGYEAITPGTVAEYPDDATVVVGGSIEEIIIAPVKNPKSKIFGQEMVRIKLSNAGESIDVVLFPKQLAQDDQAGGMIRQIQEYTPIVIKGRVSRFGGRLSLTYEAGWVLL